MVHLLPGLATEGLGHRGVETAGNVQMHVGTVGFSRFALDRGVGTASNATERVIADGPVAVVPDHLGAVVLGQQIQVSLGVDVDLFLRGLVLEAQLVAALALVGLGFQGGAGLVFGQGVRWLVGGVMGAPGDDRLVRVTVYWPPAQPWLTRSQALLCSSFWL